MVRGRRGQFYRYQDKFYPSVTSILAVIAKPALIEWAAKVAAENVLMYPETYSTVDKARASIYIQRDDAAARGTDAHLIAENYGNRVYNKPDANAIDKNLGILNPFHPAIVSFFNTMKPEIIASEITLINTKEEYAGTADLVAKMADGRTYIIDFKTSKAVYSEYPLQVEAYRQCDKFINKQTELLEDFKTPDAGAIVIFRTDGTFEWHETKGEFKAFLAAKELFEWKQRVEK